MRFRGVCTFEHTEVKVLIGPDYHQISHFHLPNPELQGEECDQAVVETP